MWRLEVGVCVCAHVMCVLCSLQPGCCAALTGVGLRVGQQILSVNEKSLFNLQHKEGAIAIKNAFDNTDKVMKLTVLDPSDD